MGEFKLTARESLSRSAVWHSVRGDGFRIREGETFSLILHFITQRPRGARIIVSRIPFSPPAISGRSTDEIPETLIDVWSDGAGANMRK
jgi:hypothetical protein